MLYRGTEEIPPNGEYFVTNVVPKRHPGKGGFPGGALFMEPHKFTDSDTMKGVIFLCMLKRDRAERGN